MTHPPLKLLLLGATGAVGQAVWQLAQADARFAQVVAPTRRPLRTAVADTRHTTDPAKGLAHEPALNPLVNFNALDPNAPWWQADALVCTLGTTRRLAGSDAAFVAVDRDLVLATARLARAAGVTRCAYNSSLGASLQGNLYLRTKAETEQGLATLGFDSLTLVRPSLIDTDRTEPRPAERAGVLVSRWLAPTIPRTWRAVTPTQIARALLDGVAQGLAGQRVLESKDLW